MADYPWETDFYKKYPTRVISGNDILEIRGEEKVLIGRTINYCNDLEATLNDAISKAEDYYNELVSAGLKLKPKTQEEINLELLKTIQALNAKIDRLEELNDECRANDKHDKKGLETNKS